MRCGRRGTTGAGGIGERNAMTYRIRQIRVDRYVVEEKGWFFWHNIAREGFMGVDWPICFASERSAQAWLDKQLAEWVELDKYNSFKSRTVREL